MIGLIIFLFFVSLIGNAVVKSTGWSGGTALFVVGEVTLHLVAGCVLAVGVTLSDIGSCYLGGHFLCLVLASLGNLICSSPKKTS